MSLFLSIVSERAPAEAVAGADIISSLITSKVDVEEMRGKRGADFSSTKFYQIRVKPTVAAVELKELLNKIHAVIKSGAEKYGFSEIHINNVSRNSSKYSSVSFKCAEIDYDIVVAAGKNKGESFEKELLLKLDNLISGHSSTEEAEAALAALQEIDPAINRANIVSITPRSGSTQRSGAMTPEETGKIIADIIIKLKKGEERYISVKNKSGTTVAQFGVAKAFTDDLKVVTDSQEWKNWLEPFGLEKKKLEEGMKASESGADLSWPDIVEVDRDVKPGTPLFLIFEKLWGLNYLYLREKSGGFFAMKVDRNTMDTVILSNLRITEIRYPSKARKQVTIAAVSDSMKFRIDIRNPRGKGIVKPTQIQLSITKSFI